LPLPSGIHSLGTPFIELQSVDSTNNYALAQIHAKLAQPGTCYFAHEQTSGKGQRGKTWATDHGMNIIISLVLKPGFLQPIQQFQLSACVAVATHQFLAPYAGSSLRIKWPNDIYWQDRKLGGILIENILRSREPDEGTWDWSVVGIGININQASFTPGLKNPVSLKQVTGNMFNQIEMAKGLCACLDQFYKKLMNKEADAILDMYNQFLYKRDEMARLKRGSRVFSGVIKKVTRTGQLEVQHGVEEQFDFGDIEWLQ